MKTPLRSVKLAQVTEWDDGQIRSGSDDLAAEEPLQILSSGSPLVVTMRTPGHDRELAAGFLWTEGLIKSRDQILSFRDQESASELALITIASYTANVELRDDV